MNGDDITHDRPQQPQRGREGRKRKELEVMEMGLKT